MNRIKADLTIIELRHAIEHALVENQSDMGISKITGNYSNSTLTIHVHLAEKTADGTLLDGPAINLDRMWELLGFTENPRGKTIAYNGTGYTITGYNPRSRKFGIEAKRTDDSKRFKLPVLQVKLKLNPPDFTAKFAEAVQTDHLTDDQLTQVEGLLDNFR